MSHTHFVFLMAHPMQPQAYCRLPIVAPITILSMPDPVDNRKEAEGRPRHVAGILGNERIRKEYPGPRGNVDDKRRSYASG